MALEVMVQVKGGPGGLLYSGGIEEDWLNAENKQLFSLLVLATRIHLLQPWDLLLGRRTA